MEKIPSAHIVSKKDKITRVVFNEFSERILQIINECWLS